MFNYQTDRVLRDEIAGHRQRIFTDLQNQIAATGSNTLQGRGFTRRVDGRDVYIVRVPRQGRPVLEVALVLGALGVTAALIVFAGDITAAGIALGDYLGITAR